MTLDQTLPQDDLRGSRRVALDLIERLRKLEEPEPLLIGNAAQVPTDQELRTGRFVIENRPVFLCAPVDWMQDPFHSRSWRFQLNSFTWLKPLLWDRASSRRKAALVVARDLVLDWARAHSEPETRNEFAWYDMAVGLRGAYIAYVLRACLVEDMLDENDAALLLQTAIRHGDELAEQDNYSSQHNHGLFQDEGLYLLAQQLPLLPLASEWRDVALNRLRSTLEQTICIAEGGHLEHSSSYQFTVAGLLIRLAENMPEMDDLAELRDRLMATSAWHVTPASRMAQLGDTDDILAPEWASRAASGLRGLNALFATGQAFVRETDSYLSVSAAHHGVAHKQADETGFIMVENGVVVLGDTGRWGYHESEPDRIYARSAAAHNVLNVDDLDFQWRQSTPYGSGLVAAGHSPPWYGIVARNPTLRRQGVDHRRLLLYRPGCILLVVDDVRSDAEHNYARHFHFGPGVRANLEDSRIALAGDRLSATLTDHSGDTAPALHRGIDNPRRLGWTYPAERSRKEISTAVLRARARSALLVTSVSLGAEFNEVTAIVDDADRYLLALDSSQALEVQVDSDHRAVQIFSRDRQL